jgi:hypothetical protein
MPQTAHIVGMYKSGTSWLLQCLAAHPDVVAWREFDPINASYQRLPPAPDGLSRLRAIYWTFRGRLDLAHGNQRLSPKSTHDAFSDFFMGTGWIPVNGSENRRKVSELPREDLAFLADELFRLAGKGPAKQDHRKYLGSAYDRALGVANLKREDLIDLMQLVMDTEDTTQLPALFYKAISDLCDESCTVAFKAADQIMTFTELMASVPNTRAIVTVRDGRDAVVSAAAFQRLMTQQDTPWQDERQPTFAQAVTSWALRASLVARYSTHANLYVLRYEDLIANFDGVMADVYRFLGLAADAEIVQRAKEHTSFENMSGGRARGEEAASIYRKGVVGDWQEKLSSKEKELAWRIARRQLKQFDYSKEGLLKKSLLVDAPFSSA